MYRSHFNIAEAASPELSVRSWLRGPAGRIAAALAALTAVYAGWVLVAAPSVRALRFVSDLAQALMSIAACAATVFLCRHPRLDATARRAWRRAAIAFGVFAAAQCCWFYNSQIQGAKPFPSAADFGFLAFYPLMLVALLAFPTAERAGSSRRRLFLDTLSVMVAGTIVVWYFIVLPTVASGADIVKIALNTAYIVGDLVLLVGITTIILRRPAEHLRRPLLIVVSGLVNFLFADVIFAFVTLHNLRGSGPLVVLWVTGSFLLAAAALYQYHVANVSPVSEVIPGEALVPRFSWLPYCAIVVGYGVLVYSSVPYRLEPHGIVVLSALVLTGIVVLRQITAVKENIRLHSLQAARESESHFRTLIENSSDIVMIFDLEGRITYQSPSVHRILGYEQDSLIGEIGLSFVHPDDLQSMKDASRLLKRNSESEVLRECRFRHFDGSWRILEGIAKIISDDESGTRGILLNARDVNERKALESKLFHQAFHDPLTNLANRLLFKSRVEEALITAAGGDFEVAVLFLDLDDFKNINDTLGHEAGDKLLIELTEKLRLCVRARDTVARLGGDEFAILIEGGEVRDKAVSVAARVLENVSQSFNLGGIEVKIGISIGIAFKDATETTAEELLRNADVAMYSAKGKGKNRYVVYETEMHRNLLAQVELEKDLRQAIETNQLNLNYQPIINMRSGLVTGMEALVRWKHPTRGMIPPVEFIAIAEQTGLIVPLGRWILLEACLRAKSMFERHGNELTVTINISGKQLEHPEFIGDLAEVIRKVRIDPGKIILEITESTMMEDTETILRLLHRIKSLGIRLAIDDFGTGYSSLSYLQQFPIDILKIDRSFVTGIEVSPQKNAVARTIINLSDTLQLATVAEGIENNHQAEILRELGCEFGQGYFFSRPMEIGQFDELLSNMNAASRAFAPVEEIAELVSGSVN